MKKGKNLLISFSIIIFLIFIGVFYYFKIYKPEDEIKLTNSNNESMFLEKILKNIDNNLKLKNETQNKDDNSLNDMDNFIQENDEIELDTSISTTNDNQIDNSNVVNGDNNSNIVNDNNKQTNEEYTDDFEQKEPNNNVIEDCNKNNQDNETNSNQESNTSSENVDDMNTGVNGNINNSYTTNEKLYPTVEACNEAALEIAFKDTTDIINVFCFSVAENGKLLGYRTDINCISGNCDKYK